VLQRVSTSCSLLQRPRETGTHPLLHLVWCGVLCCVSVRCSVLRHVAVCCRELLRKTHLSSCTCYVAVSCSELCCSMLRRVAAYCSVMKCVAACCSVLQCVAACCSVLQCVAVTHAEKYIRSCTACSAVCCIVLHCVAVHSSVLQSVAERCSDAQREAHVGSCTCCVAVCCNEIQ